MIEYGVITTSQTQHKDIGYFISSKYEGIIADVIQKNSKNYK